MKSFIPSQWLTATLGLELAWQAFLAPALVSANPVPEVFPEPRITNRAACSSSTHPNPVVILHGLGANKNEDLNFLEAWLQTKGFCTYSLTYGEVPLLQGVGGLQPIATSAQQIGAFINQTLIASGAQKVDLVGHSEGAFQSLYVPKFEGVASSVDKIVAIAPPTHGTTFAGLYSIGALLAKDVVDTVLQSLCAACDDLVTGGAAVTRLNVGPIVQPGNTVTVITSKYDELVTPTKTAFISEGGVNNMYVQDYCPLDPVGHLGEGYDTNVWNLVLNALESATGRKFVCFLGPPGK